LTINVLNHSTIFVECQHFGLIQGCDMRHKKRATSAQELGKELGRAIATRRKAKNLTQDDLAGMVEVDAETISRFERGTSAPSIERLFELCQALDVGVGDLLSVASHLAGDRVQQLAATMQTLEERDQKLVVDFASLLQRR
jgi:transcriptional regulator with XRE-family HTH domain